MRWIAMTVVALSMLGAGQLTAGEGGYTYRTIARQDARMVRGATRYPAQIEALPARPYAWGWFGAAPRSYGGYQRDYYNGLRYSSRAGW
jgi:hypothetical protein